MVVPALGIDMIEKSKQHGLIPTTLNTVIYGGAPCSEHLGKELEETFNIKSLFVSIE